MLTVTVWGNNLANPLQSPTLSNKGLLVSNTRSVNKLSRPHDALRITLQAVARNAGQDPGTGSAGDAGLGARDHRDHDLLEPPDLALETLDLFRCGGQLPFSTPLPC